MKKLYPIFAISLLALTTLAAPLTSLMLDAGEAIMEKESTAHSAAARVQIYAAGRGNPQINLSDGRELAPADALSHKSGTAEARALSAADFDEDGVSDLVTTYAVGDGGVLTVHRGNADTIYPNSAEARRGDAETRRRGDKPAPFLPAPQSFTLPFVPDFAGAGDFNADGHADLALATRGVDGLYLLPGDGRGGFGATVWQSLPGRVTALLAGEVNRRDGLEDLLVGVVGKSGPAALVFEASDGAFKAAPEVFALPAEANAFALGHLDEDYTTDAAVAAGDAVLLIHGRDRETLLPETARQVKPARVERHALPFTVSAMTTGDFRGDQRTELALLSDDGSLYLFETRRGKETRGRGDAETRGKTSRDVWTVSEALAVAGAVSSQAAVPSRLLVTANISTYTKDDLLVLDQANRRLQIVTSEEQNRSDEQSVSASAALRVSASLDAAGEPLAALPLRLNKDALSDLVLLTREGSAPVVVLTEPVTIRTVNSNADSGAGSLRQAILDSNNSPGLDEIRFQITFSTTGDGDPTLIRPQSALATVTDPLTIDAYNSTGSRIVLSAPAGNAPDAGLNITAGSTAVQGAVLSGFNLSGIFLQEQGGNVIEDCYFGVDREGRRAAGGAAGVIIADVSNNTIGGAAAAARNIISAHSGDGVRVVGPNAERNNIAGNYIGTDVNGREALSNALNGIYVEDAPDTTIGGNVVAGNGGDGIQIVGSATSSGESKDHRDITPNPRGGTIWIHSGLIGLAADGLTPLPNSGNGIAVNNVPTILVGGSATGKGNVVSSNGRNGMQVNGVGAEQQHFVRNIIGADAKSAVARGNSLAGVRYELNLNGPPARYSIFARNVVSGNGANGMEVVGYEGTARPARGARERGGGTWIFSGLVGVAGDGETPLPNNGNGILIDNVPNNYIGDLGVCNPCPFPLGGGNNVISGNGENGVKITGAASTNNLVQGNLIGTDLTGNAALGNTRNGILVENMSFNTDATIAANVVSGNGANGIEVNRSEASNGKSAAHRDITPNAKGGTIWIHSGLVGTNATGTAALPNQGNGILIRDTSALIGGDTRAQGNTISGNGANGLVFDFSSAAMANSAAPLGGFLGVQRAGYCNIGTSSDGTAAIPNGQNGILVALANPEMLPAHAIQLDSNLVSGNSGHGIEVVQTTAPLKRETLKAAPQQRGSGNWIFSNLVGINHDQTAALPNGGNGISIRSSNVAVGGITSELANVIGGNAGDGIYIKPPMLDGELTHTTIESNFIGTDSTGTRPLGNRHGIYIEGANTDLLIGGLPDGAAETIITDNREDGIRVVNATALTEGEKRSRGEREQDSISPDGSSSPSLPFSPSQAAPEGLGGGVWINSGVRSGGGPGGNAFEKANAPAGLTRRGNGGNGISVVNSQNVRIGNPDIPARPVIVNSNGANGVEISGNLSRNVLIESALIGVDENGAAGGNILHGVLLSDGAHDVTIGGPQAEARNIIAHNGGDGIRILDATANRITGNSIYSNNGLGIDLGGDGVTSNDANDADTGANNLQNFPLLNAPRSSFNSTHISGSLHSKANTTYRVEFYACDDCDESQHGEGQTFLGFAMVTTDAMGNANISVTLPLRLATRQVVTATATDSANNTSEFSPCARGGREERDRE